MRGHHENCQALTVGCMADTAHCAELELLQSIEALSQHFDRYYSDVYPRQRKTAGGEEVRG